MKYKDNKKAGHIPAFFTGSHQTSQLFEAKRLYQQLFFNRTPQAFQIIKLAGCWQHHMYHNKS